MGKGIGGTLTRDPQGKIAELGRPPGAAHQGNRGAADRRCPHEEKIRRSRRLLGGGGEIIRVLLHRIGLPSEQSLIHEAIARREEPAIGGDDGARLAAATTSPGSSASTTTCRYAPSRGTRASSPTERRSASTDLGAALLHHVEHHAHGDDDNNDDEARHLAGPGRQRAGKEQNEDQGIGEAVYDLPPKRPAGRSNASSVKRCKQALDLAAISPSGVAPSSRNSVSSGRFQGRCSAITIRSRFSDSRARVSAA